MVDFTVPVNLVFYNNVRTNLLDFLECKERIDANQTSTCNLFFGLLLFKAVVNCQIRFSVQTSNHFGLQAVTEVLVVTNLHHFTNGNLLLVFLRRFKFDYLV